MVPTEFIWLGPQITWMTPTVFTVAAVLIALTFGAVRSRLGRFGSDAVAVAIIAFPGYVSILLTYPRLHRYALLLLAAGLAMQTGRWLAGRSDRFWREARWQAGLVPLAIATIFGAQNAYGWARERIALGGLPAGPSAPNVVVIILDTVRAWNLSVYGYGRETTPRLEALGRNGVVFDRAISPSSWTLPSHATLFTGLRPFDHGASWRRPIRADALTLAQALRERGYHTGGFVANVLYTGYETGVNRGFIRYEDYRVTPAEWLLSTALSRKLVNAPWVRRLVGFHDVIARKDGQTVTREFLAWQLKAREPFFAFLNYLDAHEPYGAPPEFEGQFGPVEPRDPTHYVHRLRTSERMGRAQMPEAEQQAEMNAYDGAISYLDSQVGIVLDSLAARDALANTIVIVTSDHGEHFGEHGKYAHGDGLYLPVISVPLIVAGPIPSPTGQRVRVPVSLENLPATVWSLTGMEGPPPFPGRSLERLWEGPPPKEQPVAWSQWDESTGEPRWMTSIVTETSQYIRSRWRDIVTEELFDLTIDTLGEVDRARDPQYADQLTFFRNLITAADSGSTRGSSGGPSD